MDCQGQQQELSFEESSAIYQEGEQKLEGEGEEREQNISFANQSFGG